MLYCGRGVGRRKGWRTDLMMLLRELVRVLVLPAAAFFSFLGDRSRLGDMPCCRRSVAGKAPVHLFLSGLTDGPSFPPTHQPFSSFSS